MNRSQNNPTHDEKVRKACGCSGVRWCAACRDPEIRAAYKMDPALELPEPIRTAPLPGSPRIFEFDAHAGSLLEGVDFEGMIVIPDLLSSSEAAELTAQIERSPFSLAQSGKQKQHFGPKINFNKQRVNTSSFAGLPAYLPPLEDRLKSQFLEATKVCGATHSRCSRALENYRTTDLFVLRYEAANASNLDLHVDDTFAYGEAIFDVSLESDSVMTFIRKSNQPEGSSDLDCVRVPLPARSAALLFGRARFEWEHGILYYDIRERRTSVTLRTLSDPLRKTDAGREVLEIAHREIP